MGFFGKPFQPSKPEPKKIPSHPSKPKTIFEEKKDWARRDLQRKATQSSHRPRTLYGQALSIHAERKLWDETLPSKRFGTHISETEAKKRLRELRKQETFAKTYAEKQKTAKLRGYLEKETGLKGKY